MKKRYNMIFLIICIVITLIASTTSIMEVNATKEKEAIEFVKI